MSTSIMYILMGVFILGAVIIAASARRRPVDPSYRKNKLANELKWLKVGIDEGDKEHVETIAAGKTGDLSAKCKDGCGLTGPWGFSWMAAPGEKLVFKDAKLNGATVTEGSITQ